MENRFKIVLWAAVAVAAVAWILSPGGRRAAPRDVATFATWNMEWFPSGWPEPRPERDEKERIRKAAAALRAEGVPDVLLVQEVRDAETCNAFARELGPGAPELAVCSDFWFTPTNRGLQQVAVFSRFPVLAAGSESWVAGDFVYPPRGFAWAILDVNGEKVAVFDVHLKSNYIPEDQDQERQTVLNRLKREFAARQLVWRAADIVRTNGWNVSKVLLAGDFNTAAEDLRFEQEKTMRLLEEAGYSDAFSGIPESERPTLEANQWYPAATFDHIYVSGFPEPYARRVGKHIRTSDHAPLYASWIIGSGDAPDAAAVAGGAD